MRKKEHNQEWSSNNREHGEQQDDEAQGSMHELTQNIDSKVYIRSRNCQIDQKPN